MFGNQWFVEDKSKWTELSPSDRNWVFGIL